MYTDLNQRSSLFRASNRRLFAIPLLLAISVLALLTPSLAIVLGIILPVILAIGLALRDADPRVRTLTGIKSSSDWIAAQTIRNLEDGENVILWEYSLPELRHRYISPVAVTLLGYSLEQICTPGFWRSIVHEEDRESTRMAIRRCFDSNENYQIDYRVIRADGEIVWLRTFGHVVDRQQGIISGYYTNNTSEAEARQEIARQSRLLDCLYRLSQEISEVIDANSLCDIFGRYLREEFGYYHVAVMEADCEAELLHAIHISGAYADKIEPQHHTAPFNRGVMGRAARTMQEVIVNDVSNSDLFFAVSETQFNSEACFPLAIGDELLGVLNIDSLELNRFDENEVNLLKAIARQLAGGLKRVQLFKGLAVSEDRLEMAMQGGQTVIWDWKIMERKLHVSSNWTAVTDLPELTDDNGYSWLLKNVLPDDAGPLRSELISHLKQESDSIEVRFRIGRDGCEPVWLLAKGRVFSRAADGRALRALGTFQNISAQKARDEQQRQLESQMYKAQKLESLGVLAGGLAHDFNNLLTGILGNASLATEEVSNGSHVSQMLDEIIKGSVQAAVLTRQMLAYSGQGQFVIEPISIEDTVNRVVQLLGSVISKKAELRFEMQPDLPPVLADEAQIVQVVMNLIANASDALNDNIGMITVTTEFVRAEESIPFLDPGFVVNPHGYIRLSVRDTGCGMDQTTLRHLFDPFFTTKEKGHGLGLSAVQGIIRSHSGHIDVESTPGKGTAFILLLPVCEGEVKSQVNADVQCSDSDGKTVLLVDDEVGVRKIASKILERNGFRVLQAADGRQGLEAFREAMAEIDFVIADLTMPEMSGAELLREIHMLDSSIPVIVTSGYAESEVLANLGDFPNTSFVQKPFTLQSLLEGIQSAMATTIGR